jgi:hypothetical protein
MRNHCATLSWITNRAPTSQHEYRQETMKITKQQALDMLDKIGPRDLIPEATQPLPDPIDIERDSHLLARYGLQRGQLIERFGASP